MKSQLKKLKSHSLKTNLGQIILKQPIKIQQTQFDNIYFTTNLDNVVCKIYDLTANVSYQRFNYQKNNYHAQLIHQISPCLSSQEIQIRKKNYAYLLISKTPKQTSLRQKIPNFNQTVKLCKQMLQMIIQLKKNAHVILNLSSQNIYLNSDNKYSILEPVYITKQGQRNNLAGPSSFLLDRIQKQYKYFSPQLLDSYMNIPIDHKSDLFVLGCILYQCLTGQYPYESRYAAISMKLTNQNNKKLQNPLGKVIYSMLQNYKKRTNPQQLLNIVSNIKLNQQFQASYDDQAQEQQFNNNNQLQKIDQNVTVIQKNQQSGGFFDGLKSAFKKITTETQGWFLSYIENDSKQPDNKFLDLTISKLHKKTNKLEKLQLTIKNALASSTSASFNAIIKGICFIGYIIRKGPQQVLKYSSQWKQICNTAVFICPNNVLITQLCKVITLKLQTHEKIGKIFYGNFAIEDITKFSQIKIQSFQALADYLKSVVLSLSSIAKKQIDLIKIVINIYCDQIYDLLSILIISIISIKKDNELNLRKDQLRLLIPIQNILNGMLRKVSSLSNYISAHAIYSVQLDYSFYRQEIQLRLNPHYTAYQHFYRSCRYYKGLTLPINYNQAYSSGSDISKPYYGSNDSNQQTTTHKISQKQQFFKDDLSDDQFQKPSQNQYQYENKNVSHSDIRDKKKLQKMKSTDSNQDINKNSNSNKNKPQDKIKNLFSEEFIQSKPINKNIPSPTNKKKQLTKSNVFNFDQFLQISSQQTGSAKKSQIQLPTNKNNDKKQQHKKEVAFDFFGNFDFADNQNKKPLENKNQQNKFGGQVNSSKNINQGEAKKYIIQKPSFQEKDKKSISSIAHSQVISSSKQQTSVITKNQSSSIKKQSNNKNKFDGFDVSTLFGKESTNPQRKVNKNAKLNPAQISWILQKNDNFAFPQSLDTVNLKIDIQSPMMKEVQQGLRLQQLKNLISKHPQVIVQFKDLKFDKTIGSGSAGQVYLGKYKQKVIAIKKVKTQSNPNALKEFQRQLVTYLKIKQHPNLVSLIGLSRSEGNYYLLTEFCSAGSLFDLLHKKANIIPLDWKQRYIMALQIARGMLALHQMKPIIIHRDLKSLNVFVSQQNGKYIMKVADFGLSRSPQAQMMTSALGTLHWMAPQLLQNMQYSFKVDVYSYGILLWQICARKTPYHTLNGPMAIMKYVTIERKRPGIEFISQDCPPGLVLLIQKCWAHDSHQRPTFKQIISALQKIVV